MSTKEATRQRRDQESATDQSVRQWLSGLSDEGSQKAGSSDGDSVVSETPSQKRQRRRQNKQRRKRPSGQQVATTRPQNQVAKNPPPQQQKQEDKEGGGDTAKVRLDLNLDVEVQIKARVHGELTLAVLG